MIDKKKKNPVRFEIDLIHATRNKAITTYTHAAAQGLAGRGSDDMPQTRAEIINTHTNASRGWGASAQRAALIARG